MTDWLHLSSLPMTRLPPENPREMHEQEREAEKDRRRGKTRGRTLALRSDQLCEHLATRGLETPGRDDPCSVVSSSGHAPWKSTLLRSWFLTLKPLELPLRSPGRQSPPTPLWAGEVHSPFPYNQCAVFANGVILNFNQFVNSHPLGFLNVPDAASTRLKGY